MDDLMLTPAQVADVTGIRSGRDGKTREDRQCDQLRKMGIPFYKNARGAPVVIRDALMGQKRAEPTPRWAPSVAR